MIRSIALLGGAHYPGVRPHNEARASAGARGQLSSSSRECFVWPGPYATKNYSHYDAKAHEHEAPTGVAPYRPEAQQETAHGNDAASYT